MENEILWNVSKTILEREKEPLLLSRVAAATGLTELDIIERLIKYSSSKGTAQFNIPATKIISLS